MGDQVGEVGKVRVVDGRHALFLVEPESSDEAVVR